MNIRKIIYEEVKKAFLLEDVFTTVKGDASIYWGDKVKFTDKDYEKLSDKLKSKIKPNKDYRLTGFGGSGEKGYFILEDENEDSLSIIAVSKKFKDLITAVTVGGM